jgi:hypothetical protein
VRLNLREVVNDYRWLARKQIRLVSKCSLASIARKLCRSVSYTCKKGTQKRFSLLISYFFYLSSQFHIRVNNLVFKKVKNYISLKVLTTIHSSQTVPFYTPARKDFQLFLPQLTISYQGEQIRFSLKQNKRRLQGDSKFCDFMKCGDHCENSSKDFQKLIF